MSLRRPQLPEVVEVNFPVITSANAAATRASRSSFSRKLGRGGRAALTAAAIAHPNPADGPPHDPRISQKCKISVRSSSTSNSRPTSARHLDLDDLNKTLRLALRQQLFRGVRRQQIQCRAIRTAESRRDSETLDLDPIEHLAALRDTENSPVYTDPNHTAPCRVETDPIRG